MKIETINNVENNFLKVNKWFSIFARHYLLTRKSLNLYKKKIFDLCNNTNVTDDIKSKMNRRGYQPQISKEEGILQRIKNAKLDKLIVGNLDSEINTPALRGVTKQAEMNHKSHREFNGDINLLIQAAERVFKHSYFPKQKFTQTPFQDVWEHSINKSASSGYPLFRKKGELRDYLINGALDTVRNNNCDNLMNNPMILGFRCQLRQSLDEIKMKLRVMYPVNGIITMIETSFVDPFVKHYQNKDTFYTIGRNGYQVGKILKRNFKNKRNIVSLDVESFDQHMTDEVIILAFGILRMQLDLPYLYQNKQFEFVQNNFITSLMTYKVGRKDPVVYQKLHGIPSGSGFTNLIGTLSHAIIMEYLIPNVTKNNAQICADDNIFYYNDKPKTLFNKYYKIFCLKISKPKTFVTNDCNELHYLGFKWINFKRHVYEKLVLNQCVWHTDYRIELDKYEREVARCASTLLNGLNGAKLFRQLFPDVINVLRKGYDIKFTYMRSTKPPTKLFELEKNSSNTKYHGDTEESLMRHLRYGYLIR